MLQSTNKRDRDACLTSVVCGPPYIKRNIDELERVLRRATKFILKSDDPYDIHLKKLNRVVREEKITDLCGFLT